MSPLLSILADAGIAPAAPIFGGIFLVFMILAVVTSLFWLWMLIDALTNETGTDRIVWVLVIFFLHFLGALLYFFIRRGSRSTRTA
jgi:hypothetical protein